MLATVPLRHPSDLALRHGSTNHPYHGSQPTNLHDSRRCLINPPAPPQGSQFNMPCLMHKDCTRHLEDGIASHEPTSWHVSKAIIFQYPQFTLERTGIPLLDWHGTLLINSTQTMSALIGIRRSSFAPTHSPLRPGGKSSRRSILPAHLILRAAAVEIHAQGFSRLGQAMANRVDIDIRGLSVSGNWEAGKPMVRIGVSEQTSEIVPSQRRVESAVGAESVWIWPNTLANVVRFSKVEVPCGDVLKFEMLVDHEAGDEALEDVVAYGEMELSGIKSGSISIQTVELKSVFDHVTCGSFRFLVCVQAVNLPSFAGDGRAGQYRAGITITGLEGVTEGRRG